MGKKLSEMTLEELWQLFPIILEEHNPSWKKLYIEERDLLLTFLPLSATIHHIGSTSIEGIWAKPIVDIMVVVTEEDFLLSDKVIIDCGYACMNKTDTRISYNKGYTEKGFDDKVFHLHLRKIGDTDEIFFRDYLIDHPEVAKEYEKLKLSIWKKYEYNRDGYTNAKGDFITYWTNKAKQETKN